MVIDQIADQQGVNENHIGFAFQFLYALISTQFSHLMRMG